MTERTEYLSDPEVIKCIENIKSGSINDFEIIYDGYQNYIYTVILDKLLTRSSYYNISSVDSEDIFSIIMQKIFSNLDKFDPSEATFKTWVAAISVNCVADWFRSKKLNTIFLDDDMIDTLPDNSASENYGALGDTMLLDVKKGIYEIIQKMNNDLLKTYLNLRFVLLFDYKEIAVIFDADQQTVRSNICRALKQFSEYLKQHPVYGKTDIKELVTALKEGAIWIDDKGLEKIPGDIERKVIQSVAIDRKRPEEAARQLNIPLERVFEILKEAAWALSQKRVTREETEMTKNLLNEDDEKLLCSYIDDCISGVKKSATRQETDSKELRELKYFADLLIALGPTFSTVKEKKKSFGTELLKEAMSRKLGIEELSKIFEMDYNSFSAILNNKLSDRLKSDGKFIKTASDFLKIADKEVMSLIENSKPPVLSGVTRNFFEQNSNLHDRTKTMIRDLLEEQYGKNKHQ